MSTSNDIRTINCTQCGAPLELHGGRQVRSLTCGYCGSVMDAHEDFKIVRKYMEAPRPPVPLKIGMKAKFKDVEFTIIGMLEYTCEVIYKWVDLQLFSPTHGYAFLTYEDGHYIFCRRTREIPKPSTISSWVSPQTRISACGHEMQIYEQSVAKVTFVEGELTWIAKLGDGVQITEAIAPPYSFSYERSGDELEYYFNEYLDPAEVHESFGIDPPRRKPPEINPSQPFRPGAFWVSLSKVGKWFTWGSLAVLLLVFILGWGSIVLDEYIDNPLQPKATRTFTVSSAGKLLQLNLQSGLNNTWAYYNLAITRKNGEEVFSLGKEISYYSGYEGGESWSEGSQSTTALFKVPEAGEYYLSITAEGERSSLPGVHVRLYEGVLVARYVVMFMIFSLICSLIVFFKRWSFETKRWAPVTGDDDDD